MARMCELCGKQAQTGHNVSHSNRKTKRIFRPNIFGKRIFDPISKVFVWLKICTRCIRTVAKKTAKYV